MDRQEKIDNIKKKLADVIINLNLCEKGIKNIIANFITSHKGYFVQEILLNNHIINFSSKVKVLYCIIAEEKITVDKDFKKAINIIMTKRNTLAHSDSVLDDRTLGDIDVDWNPDGVMTFPIWVEADPVTLIFNNDGTTNYEEIEKIIDDFDKYYKIVLKDLNNIATIIHDKYYYD
jgi:hypothetical protein